MSFAKSGDPSPGIIAVLNNGRHEIECRQGNRWILQHRNRIETVARHLWRGRSSASLSAPPNEIFPRAEQ
jgi:hypothetical protein